MFSVKMDKDQKIYQVILIHSIRKKVGYHMVIGWVSEELITNIESGLNILELSDIYECGWRKIYNHCKNNNIQYRKGFFKGV